MRLPGTRILLPLEGRSPPASKNHCDHVTVPDSPALERWGAEAPVSCLVAVVGKE